MEISLVIPGRIAGKGRPRFARVGGFVRTYTDEKTRSAEAMVRTLAAEAMQGRPPVFGPIALEIVIVQIPPESWSKRRRANTRWITGKPDCDNVIKLIGDSLNRLVWHDDSQVAEIAFKRVYALDQAERAEIKIRELVADQPNAALAESAPLFAEGVRA